MLVNLQTVFQTASRKKTEKKTPDMISLFGFSQIAGPFLKT